MRVAIGVAFTLARTGVARGGAQLDHHRHDREVGVLLTGEHATRRGTDIRAVEVQADARLEMTAAFAETGIGACGADLRALHARVTAATECVGRRERSFGVRAQHSFDGAMHERMRCIAHAFTKCTVDDARRRR